MRDLPTCLQLFLLLGLLSPACGTTKPNDTADRADTADGADKAEGDDPDGDGFGFPDDCDAQDEAVNPGADEVCDRIDNNCDGLTDEGCPLEADADWTISSPVQFDCSGMSGSLDFKDLATEDVDLGFRFAFPGPAFGAWTSLYGYRDEGEFSANLTYVASCVYEWDVEGELLSPENIEATLRFSVVGGSCGDCADTSWSMQGVRSDH